jgi:hypothetical protein
MLFWYARIFGVYFTTGQDLFCSLAGAATKAVMALAVVALVIDRRHVRVV